MYQCKNKPIKEWGDTVWNKFHRDTSTGHWIKKADTGLTLTGVNQNK
jgi:hypothetical protein